MPKERPILFNGDMVRALLDGRKTQTRRIVKTCRERGMQGPVVRGKKGEVATISFAATAGLCPYGQPGDRLWVRETHGYKIRSVGGTPHESIAYRATDPDAVHCYGSSGDEVAMKWRPSIFMPRRHSRITLEIVSVRVERLQDIKPEDCIAEGCTGGHGSISGYGYSATEKEHFRNLWESINGPESWEANPWVWVVEFKRVEASQ